jgi:hypothetical protein
LLSNVYVFLWGDADLKLRRVEIFFSFALVDAGGQPGFFLIGYSARPAASHLVDCLLRSTEVKLYDFKGPVLAAIQSPLPFPV